MLVYQNGNYAGVVRKMQMWCFGVPSRRAHTEVCNRLREVPETPQMRLYDDTRKS